MFFEKSNDDREGEVRISTSQEKAEEKEASSNRSKLEQEAKSKLLGGSTDESSGITIEDVHRQNERIIELLEEINGDDDSNSNAQELGGAAADGLL
ncbi:hypothetical protein [Candidatus Nanohalococcus occultus]|uniref:Uncharacterized protein n=1 Tax=Candidatus Nanohalococcus occultus TaxID=2978047 RepID=A0ABY8CIB2_9ARCH|nr:hypothetical protein SVXNc_0743 [Candidatus Nanohaloarchaeota archaeon SVXNc]